MIVMPRPHHKMVMLKVDPPTAQDRAAVEQLRRLAERIEDEHGVTCIELAPASEQEVAEAEALSRRR